MGFNIKKISIIMISLFIYILPANSFATLTSQCIKTSLNKIEDSNKTLLKATDEKSINEIINEKDALITDLFNCIKKNSVTDISTTDFFKRISFLKTRISTNQRLKNTLAVQRDEMEINTNKIRILLADFLSFLIHSQNTYANKDKIIARTETELSNLKKLTVKKRKDPGSGRIAIELKEKSFEFNILLATYSDVLQFTMENISKIVPIRWFNFINCDTPISTINNLKPMRNINRFMIPVGLDMGRLIVALIILVLISLLYPLFSKISNLTAAFIAKHTNASAKVEIFYNEIEKPFKTLILFAGIDIALTAFSHKTNAEPYVLAISYFIYSILYLYFSFNFIDAVAIIQFEKYGSRPLRDEIINLFINFAKLLGFVAILAIVLNHFGIKMTAILSTLGIGGLAFALAAKDTLSNLFGGITILMDDLFRQGDWIIIQEVEGTVVEVGVRSTTVRTFENALVTVPNSTIANYQVVNWSRRNIGRRIQMHIGVTYESNMQDLKNAIEDIRYMLEKHPDISKPEMEKYGSIRKKHSSKLLSGSDHEGIKGTQMVYFDRYNDYSMDILIYCFSKSINWAEWLQVKEDVLYKIHDILTNNNLEFAYPTEVRINTGTQTEEKSAKQISSYSL
ncbi:MAG: mechanosensitive ion channel family protein [Thermodesulfobacteriota bacterium]|nr:mechanosensitive ion channel family protein [Thermodesulfobacteriota bacterium]